MIRAQIKEVLTNGLKVVDKLVLEGWYKINSQDIWSPTQKIGEDIQKGVLKDNLKRRKLRYHGL